MTHREVLDAMRDGWSLAMGWYRDAPRSIHRHVWLSHRPGHGGTSLTVPWEAFRKLIRSRRIAVARVEEPGIWVYEERHE